MDTNEEGSINLPPEKIWSAWATTWISIAIIAVGSLFLQLLVGAAFVVWKMAETGVYSYYDPEIQNYIQKLFLGSDIITYSLLISDTASIIMLIWVVRKKAREFLWDYFGFKNVKWTKFLFWQAAMVGIYFLTSYASELIGISEPEFMKYMQEIMSEQSVLATIMSFIALVIAAPVFEEMMFRGFVFQGFISSKLKSFGAVVLPAIAWAVIHLQYEFIWVFIIFLMGIVFGVARLQTGSIITVISMHALNNFLSFLDVVSF